MILLLWLHVQKSAAAKLCEPALQLRNASPLFLQSPHPQFLMSLSFFITNIMVLYNVLPSNGKAKSLHPYFSVHKCVLAVGNLNLHCGCTISPFHNYHAPSPLPLTISYVSPSDQGTLPEDVITKCTSKRSGTWSHHPTSYHASLVVTTARVECTPTTEVVTRHPCTAPLPTS